MNGKSYHVALSYAGEQREYVAKVASFLKSRNVRCFYDKDEEISLWGKSIPAIFKEIFEGKKTHLVVVFISQDYTKKAFPKMELDYALFPSINQNQEYILPARFDSAEVPGLSSNINYIDLKDKTPECFAEMIIRKITEMGIYFDSDASTEAKELQSTPQRNDSEVTLTIKDESGDSVQGANIRLIHSNGTNRSSKSDKTGKAVFSLDSTRNGSIFYTIFVAHNDFPARIIDNFQCNADLTLTLKKKNRISSMIIDRTGYIPGIQGRLNPILDSEQRTYMYADNISVNDNSPQPAYFKFGKNINIEDAFGKTADIRIHRIIQGCVILDYITH